MPTEPATCEPPPEHRGEEWHWLRPAPGERPTPFEYSPRWGYWVHKRWMRPGGLYERGWRYVGPARPPKEGE